MSKQEYNKEEMSKFLDIKDWLRVARPALPAGKLHNIANIIMEYLKEHPANTTAKAVLTNGEEGKDD